MWGSFLKANDWASRYVILLGHWFVCIFLGGGCHRGYTHNRYQVDSWKIRNHCKPHDMENVPMCTPWMPSWMPSRWWRFLGSSCHDEDSFAVLVSQHSWLEYNQFWIVFLPGKNCDLPCSCFMFVYLQDLYLSCFVPHPPTLLTLHRQVFWGLRYWYSKRHGSLYLWLVAWADGIAKGFFGSPREET